VIDNGTSNSDSARLRDVTMISSMPMDSLVCDDDACARGSGRRHQHRRRRDAAENRRTE
jgi:hypothetical protein